MPKFQVTDEVALIPTERNRRTFPLLCVEGVHGTVIGRDPEKHRLKVAFPGGVIVLGEINFQKHEGSKR